MPNVDILKAFDIVPPSVFIINALINCIRRMYGIVHHVVIVLYPVDTILTTETFQENATLTIKRVHTACQVIFSDSRVPVVPFTGILEVPV